MDQDTSDPSSKSAMCPNGILAVGCKPIGSVVILVMGPLMIKFTSCFPMVGGCLGTLASSTTKAGRHDIAEILLKVVLKHQK
jgi:hypothetical protein